MESGAGSAVPSNTTLMSIMHSQPVDVSCPFTGHPEFVSATAKPLAKILTALTVNAVFFMKLRRVISLEVEAVFDG
jgi:hypothetical protein